MHIFAPWFAANAMADKMAAVFSSEVQRMAS
jgi:hypothetical protein